jgi:hypothetical protein
MPRQLQSIIHSERSNLPAVWANYRSAVNALLPTNTADINDHLVREFNRKVFNLGLNSLLIFPFDGGFRYLGGDILDPDAMAYISAVFVAGSTVSEEQQTAINTFIKEEKMAGRWTLLKRIYLPIWGAAEANAICMKSLISGTFVGDVTYGAGFVQGDGSTGAFRMGGATPTSLGLGLSDSMQGFLSIQPPTGTVRRTHISSQNGGAQSLCFLSQSDTIAIRANTLTEGSGQQSTAFPADNTTGVFTATRDSVGRRITQRNSSGFTTVLNVSGGNNGALPTLDLYAMALHSVSALFDYSDAQYGAWFVGASIGSDEQFSLSVKNLWETCTGLTLP